jgi:hypothetical protein
MTDYYGFLSGAVVFGFGICMLFFLHFWRRSEDPLFLAFGLAFGLLGVSQAILALGNIPTEERAPIYLIRLGAFALILFAIVRKNRSAA